MRFVFVIGILLIALLMSNERKVSLQLSWKNQFQFAGFYIAKEKGFYKDAGLDVEIKEYENSLDIVDRVVKQKATFGIGKSSLLIARDNKKPIVALGAIYQSSPSVLVTTNKQVSNIKDIRDKKIMITNDEIRSTSIMTMLFANGVTEKNLFLQNHNADVMACYLSNEPYSLDKAKIPYKVFNPKDYGYDFYGDILFTSQEMIESDSQMVQKFSDASKQGWLWAFEHIQQSAEIIYEKYNTQQKSLDALVYEGQVLKKFAFVENTPFFHLSQKKFQDIARVYRLLGLIDNEKIEDGFLDPLKFNSLKVNIGVLSKRGDARAHEQWDLFAKYLNSKLQNYHFSIVPLNFEDVEKSIESESVDFIITNTMQYVQLESKYGISRIATLMGNNSLNQYKVKEFGGVIFTRKDNKDINRVADIKDKTLGAVSPLSFGGWVMAKEVFFDNGVDEDDFKVKYYGTHDAVVNAVLEKKVEVGTVRTNILECMANDDEINLDDIKIIHRQNMMNFPYLLSTKLYPEWPIAKLLHTSDDLANSVLSELVMYEPDVGDKRGCKLGKWTAPLDYSSVHTVLKKLRIPPYDINTIEFIDVVKKYSLYIYALFLVIIFLIVRSFYLRIVNKNLEHYNAVLDKSVHEKTRELIKANENLKILAHTDSLTGICNRGYFFELANKYFGVAKRNGTSLQALSLDLDYFKTINDTYGHQAGDEVLKVFTHAIKTRLRDSDIFGRIGGEEFCIILQNTSLNGAEKLAENLCKCIELLEIKHNGEVIRFTVSIGLANLTNEIDIDHLIDQSDKALYLAKQNGRNRVEVLK